jgi:hypothetical protein
MGDVTCTGQGAGQRAKKTRRDGCGKGPIPSHTQDRVTTTRLVPPETSWRRRAAPSDAACASGLKKNRRDGCGKGPIPSHTQDRVTTTRLVPPETRWRRGAAHSDAACASGLEKKPGGRVWQGAPSEPHPGPSHHGSACPTGNELAAQGRAHLHEILGANGRTWTCRFAVSGRVHGPGLAGVRKKNRRDGCGKGPIPSHTQDRVTTARLVPPETSWSEQGCEPDRDPDECRDRHGERKHLRV